STRPSFTRRGYARSAPRPAPHGYALPPFLDLRCSALPSAAAASAAPFWCSASWCCTRASSSPRSPPRPNRAWWRSFVSEADKWENQEGKAARSVDGVGPRNCDRGNCWERHLPGQHQQPLASRTVRTAGPRYVGARRHRRGAEAKHPRGHGLPVLRGGRDVVQREAESRGIVAPDGAPAKSSRRELGRDLRDMTAPVRRAVEVDLGRADDDHPEMEQHRRRPVVQGLILQPWPAAAVP